MAPPHEARIGRDLRNPLVPYTGEKTVAKMGGNCPRLVATQAPNLLAWAFITPRDHKVLDRCLVFTHILVHNQISSDHANDVWR